MRRIQGLCLLVFGAILGWLSGGELASQRDGQPAETLWIGVKLLFGLASIFVGLIFLADIPGWRSRESDDGSSSPPR